MKMKDYEFWFVVGSQLLYGSEVLEAVEKRAIEMSDEMNKTGFLPCRLIYKRTIKTSEEVSQIIKEANYNDKCAGIITWMHTFSPSKLWINGLKDLQKPYCHLATQYNREIPNEEIDMDFMNLNQSAHGDREHGFIGARFRMKRKIIAGYWKDEETAIKIGSWMRAAVGVLFSKSLNVMRFGDNMRDVAVTEGDKVEVHAKLGWQVNTWPVGTLVEYINAVTDSELDSLMSDYKDKYEFNTEKIKSVEYQAKIEIAIKKLMHEEDCKAFSNNFQDLYGMEQLPGLASQRIMEYGYGYGGEGDWKISALTAVMKAMSEGLSGGTGFIEDYTYDLTKGNECSLGAHMLEVCPSLSAHKPKIEVHPLGIGAKGDPARLVFEGKEGDAIVVTLIDMGGRLRLICQDVHCIKPIYEMPNLPVARLMWKAKPNMYTAIEAWIMAGGAHHSVLSYDVTAEQIRDFARMTDIEFIHISDDTTVEKLEDELFIKDIAWKLK